MARLTAILGGPQAGSNRIRDLGADRERLAAISSILQVCSNHSSPNRARAAGRIGGIPFIFRTRKNRMQDGHGVPATVARRQSNLFH